MLNIGSWLKYYLKDFNGDMGGRYTIIKKPIRIYVVVNSYLIVRAEKGVKEGGILNKGDYH